MLWSRSEEATLTSPADELEVTLQAHWSTWAPNAKTIEQDPRATIVPERHASDDTGGERAIAALVEISAALERQITVEGTLGEGGMGIIHLATQRSVGRKVAVKTLREEHRTRANVLKLLREAWLTGSLEHPNVLPIYDVDLDEAGCPRIVLKRIEGEPWSALMHDVERAAEVAGAGDLLEFNVGVLMQVCRAVHFAHARGIVHRDLKPDNVMIGKFGEVYLLDWGIAVSLRDDPTGRLPLASAATEMAGTPAYMAPEMLGAEIGTVSEKSDVYLLGAILYEIVMGVPPHQGESARAVFSSVLLSRPKFGDHVPPEIAAIARKAMDADAERRFADAEELRAALAELLRLRGALRLAENARHRLGELERAIRADGDARRATVYKLFGECRVGFGEALAAYPDHQAARAGLAALYQAMIGYELGEGDGRAAASLLAESSEAMSAELEKRVARAVTTQEERQLRLAELERQHDRQAGQRTRWFLGGFLGLCWTVGTFAAGRFIKTPTVKAALVTVVVFWAIALGLLVWARESLLKTAMNRALTATLFVSFASNVVSLTAALITDLPHIVVFNFEFVSIAACVGLAGMTVEKRLLPAAVMFAIGHYLSSIWPDHRFDWMALCQLVFTTSVLIIWRPRSLASLRAPPFLLRRPPRD